LAGCEHNAIYLSEPGLCELIFRSQLPLAKEFSNLFCHNVLPSIRSTGYCNKPLRNHQISILHHLQKVADG